MNFELVYFSTHPAPRPNPRLIAVIVIFVLLVIVALFITDRPYTTQDVTKTSTEAELPTQSDESPTDTGMTVSPEEKLRVDAWIEKEQLNAYGDPKDTGYSGGTPLFNEGSGENIDRYEYILKNHPDRPWNN